MVTLCTTDQSMNLAKGAIIRLLVSFSLNSAIPLHGGFVKTQIVAFTNHPELYQVTKIKKAIPSAFERIAPTARQKGYFYS
jgi:hypothetical protein